MCFLFRLFLVAALYPAGVRAADAGPRIEKNATLGALPNFTGRELQRVKDGFPPPISSVYSSYFRTMGQVRLWGKESESMTSKDLSGHWDFRWFTTSPSLREIPPVLSSGEGLRVLRNPKNHRFQAQSGFAVMDVEKIKLGWAITVWTVEDTVPVPEKGWRMPVPGRQFLQRTELTEMMFDPAKQSKEVQIRKLVPTGEGQVCRWFQSETGKRSQSIKEVYRGTEMLADKRVSKSTLQRIRVPEGWKYEQIITEEELGEDGKWKSTQKTELWEVDPDGRRHPLPGERL